MSFNFYKLFAVMLAVATAGAQVVCACPSAVVSPRPQPAVTQTCAGQKDCCKKATATKSIAPPKQEPCDKCNLKHPAQQAIPQRADAPSVPLDFVAFTAGALDLHLAEGPIQPLFQQNLSPPPLLEDLFHVNSLLLN